MWGLLVMSAGPASAAGETTDLVFLVDGSGSISNVDWQIQKDGLSAALQDAAAFPRNGTIAVGVVQWSWLSSSLTTRVEVPITVLNNQTTVSSVVSRIQAMAQIGSSTNPGDGIRRGTDLLRAGAESSANSDWILCMSTDGTTNSGESLASATAYARANGVDKYSVVGIEDPPFATGPVLRSHYTPHVFGDGSVTIARSALEFANIVVGGCLGDPVELRALEVNQAVQDWHNSLPLVADKATTVRAFVQMPAGVADQRVVGRLFGRRGGADLPGSPLLAINPAGAVLAQQNIESRRGLLTDSLNFQLPASWRSGTVELEFEAAGAPVDCQEPNGPGADPQHNCVVTVAFQNEVTPETVFVGVRYANNGATQQPSSGELFEQMFRFRSILPVAGIDYRMDTMGNYSSPPTLQRVNTDLAVKRFIDAFVCIFGCSDPTTFDSRYYGVLSGTGGGLANGIPGTVSSGFLDGIGARGGTGYARNRGPHELAHSLGRHHAVDRSLPPNANGLLVGRCGEVADTAAPGHNPFETVGGNARPVLGPLSTGADNEVWGLDNRMLYADTNLAVVNPQNTFELMSYCNGGGAQGRWISAFTYRGLRGAFPAVSATATAPAADGTDFVLVTGAVDLEAGTADVGSALALTGRPPTPAGGEYRVQLLDANGAELAGADFTPEVADADASTPETATDPAVGLFTVPVAKPVGVVASVAVTHNGARIGVRTASANVPTVGITSPAGGETFTGPTVTFGWTGADMDGDAVHYTVLYSGDDGASWDTLTVNTDATTLTVPRSDLVASTTARLRVIASDGVHTSGVTSNRFTVGNNAPVVAIDAPANDTLFSSVQEVQFVAAAFDKEDGVLADTSLSWTSDLDGLLGTGTELNRNAATLREGTHVVTLTGTDQAGATTTATVRIHIVRVAQPPPPPVIEVDVEVKPGSNPAPINPRARGVVPVAIITTSDFDAITVDPTSVCFGDADDPTGGDCTEDHERGHPEDVDGDGDLDLRLHFHIQDANIEPGDDRACLTGRTLDGDDIAGCDGIITTS
ncbi:MAG TPA: DUF1194 domain-containing protein [Pseudonocardiaceae bacterium]